MADGDAGPNLDDALGALIPRDRMSGRLLELLGLLGEFPILGNIVKPMVLAGGWWLEDRKPDRVFPVLLALREWLRNVLLKVMDRSREHAEHRLFLRLVEELSTEAHKILAILDIAFTPAERSLDRDGILAARSRVPRDQVGEALEELTRSGLVNRDRLAGPEVSTRKAPVSLDSVGGPQFEGTDTYGLESYGYLFTRLGRTFITYRRGSRGSRTDHRGAPETIELVTLQAHAVGDGVQRAEENEETDIGRRAVSSPDQLADRRAGGVRLALGIRVHDFEPHTQ